MTDKIVSKSSTKEYKEGWERVFGGNIWMCPRCKKEVDYGDGKPVGKSYCSMTDKYVKMVRV